MAAAATAVVRAEAFARRLGLEVPVLLAPMAGACPPALSAAVVRAGGMGGLGALPLNPSGIADWVARFRSEVDRNTAPSTTATPANPPLLINLWMPEQKPPAAVDHEHEARLRAFLQTHGPPVPADAADSPLQDFDAQYEAVLAAAPTAASSIMGLFPPPYVKRLHAAGILWFATATTVAEARAAEAAGADVIVAQGAEAGGHRGAFDRDAALDEAVGLFSLLPQVVDAVAVPVVAAGGIADGRGAAAALVLGASAVMVGSAFLRCPEAGIPSVWARQLAVAAPEATALTRAFSGRWGRALRTSYVKAAAAPSAPAPAPYPRQRGLTAAMRKAADAAGDLDHMMAWAGQSASLAGTHARAMARDSGGDGVGDGAAAEVSAPADRFCRQLWVDAKASLQ